MVCACAQCHKRRNLCMNSCQLSCDQVRPTRRDPWRRPTRCNLVWSDHGLDAVKRSHADCREAVIALPRRRLKAAAPVALPSRRRRSERHPPCERPPRAPSQKGRERKKMSAIFTPSNQVKLTNVSVVRLKKGGKRFEVACYKNKVQEYRSRTTRDLDEVLQSHLIFLNVSKGETARDADLLAAFGSKDRAQIVLEILAKGDLQVGQEERGHHLQMVSREVATIVAEKCVNPQTRTPYPVSVIEQALGEVHFSPSTTKSAKQQALEAIKALERSAKFPIARAQMRLLVSVPISAEGLTLASIEGDLVARACQVEARRLGEDGIAAFTCLIEPSAFRQVTAGVAELSGGRGSVQVLTLRDVREPPAS